MKIIARVDANRDIGAGHAVRVRAIAHALGSDDQLLVIGKGKELRSIFPYAEILEPTKLLPVQLSSAVDELNTELVLCDHPDLEPYLRYDLEQQLGIPVIIIDDFGGDHRASGIVNGTILPTHHRYPKMPDHSLKLCGSEYALLRPSFSQANRPSTPSRTIGIVIGSGNRSTNWGDFLTTNGTILTQMGTVGIVVGVAHPEPEVLAKACAMHGISFYQALSEVDLAKFLASSEIALVTGGMVVYESLATGTPTIIFPILPNMIAEADWFAEKGCAVNLGPNDGFNATTLCKVIASLLTDPNTRNRMARRGHKLVDGLGVSRVCTELGKHFNLSTGVRP